MQALKEAAMLEEIGGIVYLNELQDVAVSAASLSHYAEQVKAKAKLRRMVALATEARARAMDATEDVDKLLSEVSNDFIALSEDYYKWCRNRTQSVLPPCVEFQISKTTKRTAKKAVKKAPRKPIKRK
jgi:replicative DNA helicase